MTHVISMLSFLMFTVITDRTVLRNLLIGFLEKTIEINTFTIDIRTQSHIIDGATYMIPAWIFESL